MTLLTATELTVSYGPIVAVERVDLSVEAGEIVAILGSNGAGKTSTMRGVLGVASHRAASLRFKEQDVASWSTPRRVAAGMTLVPEGREVFPTLSVMDNLRAGFDAKRTHTRSLASLIDEVFGRFPRLAERRQQRAGTLSGGEQQMLAIGRALMQEPELLMLDEPSLGLAPIIVDDVMDTLTELNNAGLSILMVEQDAHRALEVAHRIFVIREGRVVLDGTAGEVSEDADLHHAIFGTGSSDVLF